MKAHRAYVCIWGKTSPLPPRSLSLPVTSPGRHLRQAESIFLFGDPLASGTRVSHLDAPA